MRKKSEARRSRAASDIIRGMANAIAHAEGRKAAVRVHVVEVPDVRAIRRGLRMSQSRFATAFRIPVATIKNWEQGRRLPEAPAAAFLHAIARRPRAIIEALAPRRS
jgi:putative transcriptional regulator